MLDIETLGVSAGDVILEAAVVVYDLDVSYAKGRFALVDVIDSIRVSFDLDQLLALGFKVNAGTLRWWHEDEARLEYLTALLKEDAGDNAHALKCLLDFISLHLRSGGLLWAKGCMDFNMLKAVYAAYGYDTRNGLSFFRAERDFRTFLESMKEYFPETAKLPFAHSAHKAMIDCLVQAQNHYMIYKYLKDNGVSSAVHGVGAVHP